MMFHRSIALTGLLFILGSGVAGAQEEKDENPPPPKRDGVQIVFLPPPMEGVLSLGIFDKDGKLVRVLHREAKVSDKEFRKGVNGLITRWDGKDDAGQPAPVGKYFARGWMTGDLKIEGVAFHGNDWLLVKDAPRFSKMLAVQSSGRDEVHVVLRGMDGSEHTWGWNLAKLARPGTAAPVAGVEAALDEGKLVLRKGTTVTPVMMEEGEKAVASAAGRDGRVWAIVESPNGREVRAYSESGEFLRRLAYAKDDPAPQQIAASAWSETIFLLEENEKEQRLRALALGAPKADGTATWKTVYQKRIAVTETFEASAPALGREMTPQAVPEIKVKTKPNPLAQNARTEAKFRVAVDDKGAVLISADGLPLAHLTDTPALKWAALVQEKENVLLFEGDGAAVGEYKIEKPSNVMAFEAGDYELEP